MKDEPITVEDYKLVSDEFFQKYDFVVERMRVTAKAEDVLKVMEALSGAVMKDRVKDKVGPFGFNKNCLLYTSPSPRDRQKSRMPSSA